MLHQATQILEEVWRYLTFSDLVVKSLKLIDQQDQCLVREKREDMLQEECKGCHRVLAEIKRVQCRDRYAPILECGKDTLSKSTQQLLSIGCWCQFLQINQDRHVLIKTG